MKKQIPLSILLVMISLAGFFIIQASWVVNLIDSSRQRTIERATAATEEVANNIADRLSISYRPVPRTPLQFPEDIFFNIPRITTVKGTFSLAEIQEMFNKALNNNDEKNLYIEFGVVNNIAPQIKTVSLSTPGFIELSRDSTLENKAAKPIIKNIGMNIENGGVSESLIVYIPNITMQVLFSQWLVLLGFFMYSIITLAAFYMAIKTIIQQRNLGKIKNDFINNMTHEFKTPLATISLAVDALQNKKVVENPEKQAYFTQIIKDENLRMNKHVETILKAAFTDKQEFNLDMKNMHAHTVIQSVVDSFALQLRDKNDGFAELKLDAKNDLITADPVHFGNLINNLMDNAVKYSKPDVQAKVIVSTVNTGKYFTVKVQDNGIGMSKETAKRVFEKFYRAHTGNLHNVKGFGLGMNYVKSIVEAHKGKVRIDSELGKGSSFIVDIPISTEK